MSIENQHDDAELARFMGGDDELSAALKGIAQPVPPAALDAAILGKIEAALQAEKAALVQKPEAANDAVDPVNAEKAPEKRFLRSWWQVPLGLAAGVLLTVAFRSQFQDGRQAESVALLAPPAFAPAAQPEDNRAPAAKIAAYPAPAPAPADVARDVRTPRASPPLAYAPPRLTQAVPVPQPPALPVPAISAPIASGAIGAPPTVAARAARAAQEAESAPPKAIAANDIPSLARAELKQQQDALTQVDADKRKEAAKKSETASQEYKQRSADKAPGGESILGGANGKVLGRLDEQPARAAPIASGIVAEQAAVVAKPAPQESLRARSVAAPPPAPSVAAAPAPAPAPLAVAPTPSIAEVAIISDSSSRTVVPLVANSNSLSEPVPAFNPPAAAAYNRGAPSTEAGVIKLAKSAQADSTSGKVAGTQTGSAHLQADAWLAVIEQKLQTGDTRSALQEWAKFRKTYPDFIVDKTLETRLKALQRPNSATPAGAQK